MTTWDTLRLLIPIGVFGFAGGIVEDRYFPGDVTVFLAFVVVGAAIGGFLLLRSTGRKPERTGEMTIGVKAVFRRGVIVGKFHNEITAAAFKLAELSGRRRVEDYDIDRAFDEWVKRISGA